MNRAFRVLTLAALPFLPLSLFAQTEAVVASGESIAGIELAVPDYPSADPAGVGPLLPASGLLASGGDAPSVAELWALSPDALVSDAAPVATDLAQTSDAPNPAPGAASSSPSAENASASLQDNEQYRESLRLRKLAEDAFEYGDYDASATYAAEAASAARKSDEYVALRLKMKSVDDAILAAENRLAWARSIGAEKTYGDRLESAGHFRDDAVAERANGDWDKALSDARQSLALLADVRETTPLPKTYTVRPWATARDCFWNIAAYPFVYGDPTKWPTLYKANKAKLRQPENPDLIHPGTVLTIPSLRGEYREGSWVKGTAYEPLPPRK